MTATNRLLSDAYRQADRAMLIVLWLLFIVALAIAPRYGMWSTAITGGLLAAGIPSILIFCLPGRLITRLSVATGLMALAALHIHLTLGQAEIHFGIFVLLSFLLAYRDWRTIVCAAVVIALHHLSFNFLQQWGYSAICFTEPSLGMVILHATYVVAQTSALGWLAWKMERAAVAAEELARLSAHIGREAGVFDLQFGQMRLHSHLGNSFKTTMDAAHNTMQEVRSTATMVSAASQELAQGNLQLEEHARTHAASLAQTSAAMSDLAVNVHENTELVEQMQQVSEQTRQIANTGSQAVVDVATVMGEIQQEAHKISEITGLIDSIAFQTNILALNAAVEAARAGESGRGFAVVASEVRALAQRSAEAAREIRTVIEGSLEKTGEGFQRADHAANIIQEVVASIDKVAHIADNIGEAGQVQRRDIDAVDQAVAKMNELILETANEITQASSASAALQAQAEQLQSSIGVFKLDASDTGSEQSVDLADAPSSTRVMQHTSDSAITHYHQTLALS